MPDDDARQWRNAIPETEHRGDLQRAAPVGAKPPEGNRRPEVVQAEGEPEDEKAADHGFLVSTSLRILGQRSATSSRTWQITTAFSVCQSGSAKANSALPWEDPSILGRNPSAQPPQPLGATMYCFPSTLYDDGTAVVAAAALELPQQVTAVGVPRVELAGGLPAEHEIAARGQQRRAHAGVVRPAPPLLAGARIVGAHVPGLVLAVHGDAGAPVRDALLELPAPPRGRRADVLHGDVEELRLRAVAGVRPFLRAGGSRPEVDGVAFRVGEPQRCHVALLVDLAPVDAVDERRHPDRPTCRCDPGCRGTRSCRSGRPSSARRGRTGCAPSWSRSPTGRAGCTGSAP